MGNGERKTLALNKTLLEKKTLHTKSLKKISVSH